MIVIIDDDDFSSLYYIRVMRGHSQSKSELDHATFHELLTLIIR